VFHASEDRRISHLAWFEVFHASEDRRISHLAWFEETPTLEVTRSLTAL